MKEISVKWHKFKEEAIIPTKTDCAAGFDVYTIEKDITIAPHSQHLFSTGLGCIISPNYWLMGFDRGSTGSKGIHVHCGVVDNDYRGEIFICIKNDNPYPVHFCDCEKAQFIKHNEIVHDSIRNGFVTLAVDIIKKVEVIDEYQYPISKAIAQLIPVKMPKIVSTIASDEEWEESCAKSERGDGKLGSSGK